MMDAVSLMNTILTNRKPDAYWHTRDISFEEAIILKEVFPYIMHSRGYGDTGWIGEEAEDSKIIYQLESGWKGNIRYTIGVFS